MGNHVGEGLQQGEDCKCRRTSPAHHGRVATVAGQLVPKTTRTLPTRTQVNSYPIPSRTQRGQKRLEFGATLSFMLYPLIVDLAIV